jgi:hypothetical protein
MSLFLEGVVIAITCWGNRRTRTRVSSLGFDRSIQFIQKQNEKNKKKGMSGEEKKKRESTNRKREKKIFFI